MTDKINFLIIGAMKSGTTSLYRYLDEHPQIYMAPGKEADFFSNNKNFLKGFKWYLDKYFYSVGSSLILGEASPHYMCFSFVPERVYCFLPEIKIIAILRNPIDRAYSHYKMAVRRKKQNKPFNLLIRKLVKRGAIMDDKVDLESEFIMMGEYGRILRRYLDFFNKKNIKIIFTEELEKEPLKTMKNVYRFVGVEENFKSKIIGIRFHQGGDKRFPRLEKLIFRVKKYAKPFVPFILRKKFMFWFETQFNVNPSKNEKIKEETREFLADYYKKDVELLKKLFNINIPWEDFTSLDCKTK